MLEGFRAVVVMFEGGASQWQRDLMQNPVIFQRFDYNTGRPQLGDEGEQLDARLTQP
jgi:hypothetical protein